MVYGLSPCASTLGLLAVKKLLRKRHRDGHFHHGVTACSGRKLCSKFFTQLFEHFVHMSGSIKAITRIWLSSERCFPPAEAEHK